jgi:hypothetical protein
METENYVAMKSRTRVSCEQELVGFSEALTPRDVKNEGRSGYVHESK